MSFHLLRHTQDLRGAIPSHTALFRDRQYLGAWLSELTVDMDTLEFYKNPKGQMITP